MAETILAWLGRNWFSLAAAGLLIGMMLYGHSRGFLRLSLTMASLVITLVLVRVALPPVTEFLTEHTGICALVERQILKQSGLEGVPESQTESWEAQDAILSGLEIPEELRGMLRANNTREIWNAMGADRFTHYVAGYLSRAILNTVVFFLLFLLIWILLHLLIRVLDVVAKLPIIHGLNQIAGAVLGLAEGLIFLWVFFLVLSLFSGTGVGAAISELVSRSVWLSALRRFNLVGAFLKAFLLALL